MKYIRTNEFKCTEKGGHCGYVYISPRNKKYIGVEDKKRYWYKHIGGNIPHYVVSLYYENGKKYKDICFVCDVE